MVHPRKNDRIPGYMQPQPGENFPVAYARFTRIRGELCARLVCCPYCGGQHVHGAGNGLRVAHCPRAVHHNEFSSFSPSYNVIIEAPPKRGGVSKHTTKGSKP